MGARGTFGGVLAPAIGFGCMSASVSVLSNMAGSFAWGSAWYGPTLFIMLGSVAAATLVVARRRSVPSLLDHATLSLVVAVAGIAGALALLVMPSEGSAGVVVLISLVFVLEGAVHAYYNCAWMEALALLKPAESAVGVCLAHLVFAAVGFVASLLCVTGASRAVALVVLLSLTALLYSNHVRALDRGGGLGGEQISPDWRFPTKPVLLMAIFAYASVIARIGIELSLSNYSRLVVIVIAGGLAVYFWRRYEYATMQSLVNWALVLAIAGFLLRFVPEVSSLVATSFLENAAFALSYLFTHIALCRLSYRYGISPLLLFGSTYAAIRFSYWLGWATERQVDAGVVSFSLVAAVCVLALVVVFLLCMRIPNTLETWGLEMQRPEAAPQTAGDAREGRIASCARIARRFGLTRREEEVLVLLAEGQRVADIERSLCVSNATVKSHVQHIYVKVGVHSKQELQEVVRAEER